MKVRGSVVALLTWLGLSAAAGAAEIDILTPDMVARLEKTKEQPLTLTPEGDVAQFVKKAGEWREAAPPLVLDIDKDGLEDYVVMAIADEDEARRALVVHSWGDVPTVFGPAVFYMIMDPGGVILEWGGRHRLSPRAAPKPPAPGPSPADSPARPPS